MYFVVTASPYATLHSDIVADVPPSSLRDHRQTSEEPTWVEYPVAEHKWVLGESSTADQRSVGFDRADSARSSMDRVNVNFDEDIADSDIAAHYDARKRPSAGLCTLGARSTVDRLNSCNDPDLADSDVPEQPGGTSPGYHAFDQRRKSENNEFDAKSGVSTLASDGHAVWEVRGGGCASTADGDHGQNLPRTSEGYASWEVRGDGYPSTVDGDQERNMYLTNDGYAAEEVTENRGSLYGGSQRTTSRPEVPNESAAGSYKPRSVIWDDNVSPDERRSGVNEVAMSGGSERPSSTDEPSQQQPTVVGSEPSLPRPTSTGDRVDSTSLRWSQSDVLS